MSHDSVLVVNRRRTIDQACGFVSTLIIVAIVLIGNHTALAQGGCGSVCLPLEVFPPLGPPDARIVDLINPSEVINQPSDSVPQSLSPITDSFPQQRQLSPRILRVTNSTEFGSFHRFREGEGSGEAPNPGGNKAFILNVSTFIDYGVTDRFTTTLLLPYVRKEQNTNRFGRRVADGIGDIALFGR